MAGGIVLIIAGILIAVYPPLLSIIVAALLIFLEGIRVRAPVEITSPPTQGRQCRQLAPPIQECPHGLGFMLTQGLA